MGWGKTGELDLTNPVQVDGQIVSGSSSDERA